jgi:protein transport protein SEC13
MVTISSKIETAHRDVIHDAEMNFFGNRLATCSSDHIIKVFEVKENGQNYPIAELIGHEGPVWQISWSYPNKDKGEHLASCSYDKKVFIWKEIDAKYQRIYEYNQHDASINSVSWAPEAYGLMFACCSTDCTISVVQAFDDVWKPIKIFKAHEQGVNAISWAPARPSRTINDLPNNLMPKLIASGGNDKKVKIWKEESEDKWELVDELEGHQDWVRDVAFSPVQVHDSYTLASCGLDGRVVIWRTDDDGKWRPNVIREGDEPVYNVSWSPNGAVLAVASADNKVSLYQERIQDEWVQISDPSAESIAAE